MTKWSKWTIAFTLAVFTLFSLQVSSSSANTNEPFEPINLTELENGQELFDPLWQFVTDTLEMTDEDASAMTIDTFYEVDLGNYPKGYTRQFLTFVYNYEWIELVLIATSDDSSDIKLLNRASHSDEGYMFLNTAKLEFSTVNNHIYVWSQAPYSAYQSTVDLEWAGDNFYVTSHQYDDPSARFYEEKARLIKAKDIQGLLEQYETDYPLYPGAYEEVYTLAAPALKLAHQKALQVQKKDVKTAIKYLEYGLNQYAEGFGTWGYAEGTLLKSDIAASSNDSLYPESRLSLGTYVGVLNDYGYFLSLSGRNKEAKLVLANVIKLVPTRTVAYLNIADVEWTLGERTAAKGHYKQYWKLLGSKASQIAPKRVQERINAK